MFYDKGTVKKKKKDTLKEILDQSPLIMLEALNEMIRLYSFHEVAHEDTAFSVSLIRDYFMYKCIADAIKEVQSNCENIER